SEHTSDWQWWHINQIADLHYVPGNFVTLFGFEWSSRYGHKNVIYPRRGEPIFSSAVKGSDTPDGLWKCLEGHRALTIPHHPADVSLGTDWSFHNDQYQRLVEIFQAARGSYEYDGCPRQHSEATREGCFVQDALKKGYKLGIIASTDHGYGASYAAVFTPELTRDAVFEGLWHRRTYGATAKGIFLDFRCNGRLMGEEVETEGPPEFTGRVAGLTELAEVAIFKNGEIVYRYPARQIAAKPGWMRGWLHIEWGRGQKQWSGHLTLSEGRILDAVFYSPDSPGEEVKREGDRRLSWQSATSNGEDGVDMLIEAPQSAVVKLHTAAKDVEFRVRDAFSRDQRWSVDEEGNYILAAKRLAGTSLGTTEVSFRWRDEKLSPGTSWYYLRVMQTDGEMAWSSPIWVTRQG
ncbi:MAG: DUF3604 domain-containing protein, partial [Armatimonadetes bacterium]|nr:DUF3604 domain-containing protein [Armatimonadota bacterium]